jgi:[ribosomal protein S18]-alanine N-acetyltransferase
VSGGSEVATSIRTATVEDLPAIVAVDRATGAVGWSPAAFAEDLARADRRWLVAEDATVVGVGAVADLAGDAHVLTVAVDPVARRRGTAAALVRQLVAAAVSELGSRRVTLEVRRTNTAARALYAGCGFVEGGVRPGYYADGEDAVVLWCEHPEELLGTLPATPPATPRSVPPTPRSVPPTPRSVPPTSEPTS